MTRFRIGSHEVQVWREIGGWVVSVDQRTHRHRYMTEAQAAGAALVGAQRLDRLPSLERSLRS